MSGQGNQASVAPVVDAEEDESEWAITLATFFDVVMKTEPPADPGKELRAQLLSNLRRVVPDGAVAETLVPGEAAELVNGFIQVAGLLTTQIGTAGLEALKGLGDKIGQLENKLTAAKEAVARRGIEKKRIEKAAGEATAPEGALTDEASGIETLHTKVTEALGSGAPTEASLKLGAEALEALLTAVDLAGKAVKRRGEEKAQIVEDTKKLTAPPGAESGELESLKTAKQKVVEALGTGAPTPLLLKAGAEALDLAKKQVELIGTAVTQRSDEDKRIRKEAGEIVDPECLDDQKKRLTEARKTLDTVLTLPVATQRNKDAARDLELLRTEAKAVAIELESLGGIDSVKGLCQGLKLDVSAFATFETALGGREATAKILKSFPAGELVALCAACGDVGGERVGKLVAGFGGADKLKTAVTDLGGNDRLGALVKDGACDAGAAKKLCDDLGTGFLGALLEAKTAPADILKLQQGLGTDVKALQDVVKEGGFDTKPKALVAMFSKGCGGKPDEFAKLCAGFASGPDRATLKGLIVDGGLGDAPDCLGELFATGCGGKVDEFKTLGASFGDKDSREGLKRGLTDGGLAGEKDKDKVVIDVKTLAQMLKDGAGPPPTGFAGDEAKRKSDAVAMLLKGMKKSDCEQLKKVLVKGGLGTEPEIAGKLVGLGCKGGDLKAVTDLLTELGKDAPTLQGVGDLLKKGGLGTKNATGAATGTDPKCLGELYGKGCEGKPGELSKLATALNDTDRTQMTALLKDGLGKRPEVFGNAYKFGCVKDPYDDPDTYADPASSKDPAVLKKLLAAFGNATDAPKLEEMLKDGGLGTDPSWLGKVMRDAFTDRNVPPAHPSGKTQDPGKLKDLHSAFVGKMPEMKAMFEAMGTMPPRCGENDEPGKALQNVHKSAGVPLAQMKTLFFDTLSARGGGINGPGGTTHGVVITGASPPPVAASLTTKELLQNASSLEFDPVNEPAPNIVGANGTTYPTDLLHTMERHHRNGPTQPSAGGNNNTGMFPKLITLPAATKPTKLTEAMVKALIKDAIDQTTAAHLYAVPIPPPPSNAPGAVNPPTQHSHMNSMHQRNYKNVPASIPGATYQMQLGYGCVHTAPMSAHSGTPTHPARVGQAFPMSGTDMVQINAPDLTAIKSALGK